MKWLVMLSCAFVLSACNTPPNEVVQAREGVFRAPTYLQGQAYCQKKGSTMHALGNGPAQTGVEFSCE
jgi:starvation-inducible outer membrane lipoprotein